MMEEVTTINGGKSIGIIRNPVSGRGKGSKHWPAIEENLGAVLGAQLVRIEVTEGPGSGLKQAERMASEGIEIVVAAGGDGTISDVFQGLLGSNSVLGIIPLGTGNDFARTIRVGPNPDLAIRALAAGKVQSVDVGHWRQEGREGHFLNVAGCGFDAAVADRINQGYRRVRGTTAYVLAVLQTLRSYKATELMIEVDGEHLSHRAMLCAIANAPSYGGGMKVAPTAEISDGLLDLVLVKDLPTHEFLRAFPRVFKGTHLTHPNVEHRTFRRLVIESSSPAPFLVDGEVLPSGRAEVEVVPGALEVVIG